MRYSTLETGRVYRSAPSGRRYRPRHLRRRAFLVTSGGVPAALSDFSTIRRASGRLAHAPLPDRSDSAERLVQLTMRFRPDVLAAYRASSARSTRSVISQGAP